MLDRIDTDTFEWIDQALKMYQRVLKDAGVLLENAVPADLKSQLAFDDLKVALYSHSDDALFIGRHYLQALQMRQAALRENDFTWYVAATYALCHDWGKTRDSIDWLGWGGDAALGDIPLQSVTTLVGGVGVMPSAQLHACVAVFSSDAQGLIAKACRKGLIRKDGDVYRPGPRVPRPAPF